jgi:hypothetical protein
MVAQQPKPFIIIDKTTRNHNYMYTHEVVITQSNGEWQFPITSDELDLLMKFANTKKDKELNTIYILNDCEFRIRGIQKPLRDKVFPTPKEIIERSMAQGIHEPSMTPKENS